MPDINQNADLVRKLRDLNPWKDLDWPETARGAADAIEAQAAEISRLRDALKPFAALADDYIEHGMDNDEQPMAGRIKMALPVGPFVKFSDFRRARTALEANHG